MLLCVGSFFNNTPECQQQWKEYVEGREKGRIWSLVVPILTASLKMLRRQNISDDKVVVLGSAFQTYPWKPIINEDPMLPFWVARTKTVQESPEISLFHMIHVLSRVHKVWSDPKACYTFSGTLSSSLCYFFWKKGHCTHSMELFESLSRYWYYVHVLHKFYKPHVFTCISIYSKR